MHGPRSGLDPTAHSMAAPLTHAPMHVPLSLLQALDMAQRFQDPETAARALVTEAYVRGSQASRGIGANGKALLLSVCLQLQRALALVGMGVSSCQQRLLCIPGMGKGTEGAPRMRRMRGQEQAGRLTGFCCCRRLRCHCRTTSLRWLCSSSSRAMATRLEAPPE